MRKLTFTKLLLVACVVGTLCFVAPALAQKNSSNGNKPVLTVATDQSFPPFEMQNMKTGEIVGFDMDILEEVADRVGFKYHVKGMPFPGIEPALETASIDAGIAAIVITKKRAKTIEFSAPYFKDPLQLLVRSGEKYADVDGLSDLKGKKVATKIGSSSYIFLKNNYADVVDITTYPLTSNMYQALMGHKVAAVLYDQPNVKYFVKTMSGNPVRLVKGATYNSSYYGLAFPEGSKWVDPVSKALIAMQKDGTYMKIYKKWFGDNLPDWVTELPQHRLYPNL